MACGEVREHAAELVLGTLDGERRAGVEAHVAACRSCHDEVAELTRVTDALLAGGPEAEPPAGFESRVLARLPERAPAPARRRWRAAVVAAAALLVVVAGVVLTRPDPVPQAAGLMYDRAHVAVGRAVVEGGAVPHVLVTVDGWGDGGDYVVEVIRRDGTHVEVAPIHLSGGRGSAGGPLAVPYRDVKAVWVTDRAHTEWCSYRLGS